MPSCITTIFLLKKNSSKAFPCQIWTIYFAKKTDVHSAPMSMVPRSPLNVLLSEVLYVLLDVNVLDVGPTLHKVIQMFCTFSQTLYIYLMLVQCWASVADVGLTLKQHWINVSFDNTSLGGQAVSKSPQ